MHSHARRNTLSTGIFIVASASLAWPGKGYADAPSGRYVAQEGTVIDTRTKLMWQQQNSTSLYNIQDAASYCGGLKLNGFGWRLPTAKELLTIVDETRSAPAIDTTWFPNTPSGAFWTSTALGGVTRVTVNFKAGDIGTATDATPSYVRCVH